MAQGESDTIPACVCPQTIKFILNGKSKHKEFVTIYNPYSFSTKFKIKCSAPSKYLVSNPHGYIGAKCSFDVVFTHRVPTISNCDIVDKFKVTISHSKTQKVYRNIYIDAVLLQSENDTIDEEKQDDDVPSSSIGSESNHSRDKNTEYKPTLQEDLKTAKKIYVVILAAIAVLMLEMLPLKDEMDSLVPVKSLTKSTLSFFIGVLSCYYLFSICES